MTPKQDKQVLSLADQQMFITSRDIQNQMKRKGAEISERTVWHRLNEAGAKFSPPMLKPLLKEGHQMNCLKWAEAHMATNWDQVIFSDETTIHLNQVKCQVWNTPGKKKMI